METMPEEQAQGQQTIKQAKQMQELQEARELEKEQILHPLKAISKQVFSSGPSRSHWPLALALAISIALMGIVVYPIVFFIGMALTLVIIIAWSVDRK